MKLYRYISLKRIKKESTLEGFQRVLSALLINKWDKIPIRFIFENYHDGAMPFKRIEKRFPLMAKFRTTGNKLDECLSNLGGDWNERYNNKENNTDLVPLEILREIAEGIPKRFPVSSVHFVFDDIPFPERGPDVSDGKHKRAFYQIEGLGKPCVHLHSSWWMTGRQIEISALIPIQLAETGPQPWSFETLNFIEALGKQRVSYPICIPDASEIPGIESARSMAETMVASFVRNFKKEISGLHLPHSMPPPGHDAPIGSITEEIPRKKLIASALAPMGYKYSGSLSCYASMAFTKKTNNNNRIYLDFDFGTGYYGLKCCLNFETPFHKNQFDVLYDPECSCYLTQSLDAFKQVLENIVEVLRFCESGVIKDLDNIYGPAPEWFQYSG